MKIAVIGGGSTYTPELIMGFLDRVDNLPVEEICLMDNDPARLKVVGGFAQRLVRKSGVPIRIDLTEESQLAISGADVVITQLRVGQMPARREDEYLGLRHDLVGQETTGIGGMSKALRTIPVILDLCNQIQKTAPNALLLNFTNPSGLIMEAIQRYAPKIKAVGVCNSAFTTKMKILQRLSEQHGVAYKAQDGELLTLGLNHLTWHYGFRLLGEDVWDEVFTAYVQLLRAMPEPPFNPDFIERQRVIPNDYLEYYFQASKKIDMQKNWPPSRAEEVMVVEKDLLAQYADPACDTVPESLMQRGGAYYSTVAASMIDSYWNNKGDTHIANIVHNGQVKGWEKEWILEMPCKVDRSGVQPLPTPPLPLYNYALLEQVKQYELLTVEAAMHGDREAAFRALLAHPLGPDEEHAGVLLEDMITTHQRYLPRFFL
jgi:6-phospho-beta-glucosidase